MPILGSFGAGSARGLGLTSGGRGPYTMEYLVVAGGGAGGSAPGCRGPPTAGTAQQGRYMEGPQLRLRGPACGGGTSTGGWYGAGQPRRTAGLAGSAPQ